MKLLIITWLAKANIETDFLIRQEQM